MCLLLFAPDLCPEGSLWRSTHNLWDREYAGPSGWSGWTALRGYIRSPKGLTSKWKLIGKMRLWSPAFPDDARCSPPVCDRLLASGTREARLHRADCLEEGSAAHQMLIEPGPIWQHMEKQRHNDGFNRFIWKNAHWNAGCRMGPDDHTAADCGNNSKVVNQQTRERDDIFVWSAVTGRKTKRSKKKMRKLVAETTEEAPTWLRAAK